jgi:DNA-binding SARP family transcriptional activator
VQNQVSRVRTLAGPDAIATTSDGYRLAIPTDVGELREIVRHAEQAIADDPARVLALTERALALPTGAPFADLAPPQLAAELRREVEVLLDAAADHEVEAALALGHVRRALSAARRLTVATPVDEGRALRLARALDAAGRRGEALTELARVRRALRTELGLEAGPALEAAELAIRGATAPDAGDSAPPQELAAVLAAVDAGRPVLVTGAAPTAVARLLSATRDALLERRRGPVAMTEVSGYRDVAVAALLDLLDLLGLEPRPELGPVGTFVPAVERLASHRPVALVVDGFDQAGPSTRRVLLDAAGRDGIVLVAGARGAAAERVVEGFHAVVAVVDRHDEAARRSALRRRVAALPPEIRETLTVVAVAGDDVPAAALRDVGVGDGLAGALARELLRATPAGGIAYADDALRALVAADTPTGAREELHHALGHALARRGAVEDAAHHLLAAGEIEPPAAIRVARAAASRASASGAHHDAASWLRRAGAVCRDPRTRIAVEVELGDALRLAGDPSHVEVLQAAAEDAIGLDDEELLGEAVFALLQLGGTTVSTSVDPGVDALLRRTLPRLREPRLVALVQGAASLAFSMTGSADRSRALFLAAEDGARDPATRRRILPFAYMAIGLPEDLDRRRGHADELRRLATEADDPAAAFEALHLAASVQLQAGEGAALRATHAEMTSLVERVGDVGRRWALHYLGAALAHLDGDHERSEAQSTAAFAQFAPVSESRATAVLFGQLFGLRLTQGRVPELRPVLESLVAGQPGVPAWHAALAVALADDDPVEAITVAGRALEVAERDFTWLVSQLVAGRAVAAAVHAGADDDGLLRRCEAQLAPWSGRMSWQGTCSYGPIDTTLALLARASGEEDRARALATAARSASRRLGAPAFLDELVALGLGEDAGDAPADDVRALPEDPGS